MVFRFPNRKLRVYGGCLDYIDVRVKLEEHGFRPFGKEMLRDIVARVAEGHKVDIAIEWLSRLEWDGVPRVEGFFADYLGAADSPYARALGRYAWTAHAGRVLEGGCQADMALVLKGPQGLRKTSAIKAIAPHLDMYLSIKLGGNEDNLARRLRGKLVGELEELRGLNSVGAEEIRAWVSRTKEGWVVKYREFETSFARRLVFWGSGNEDEFLGDSAGERRWLPIEVGVTLEYCDSGAVARDRDQLWAEGAEMFQAHGGVDWQEAECLARLEHGKFKIIDAWDSSIARWFYTADSMSGKAPAEWDQGVSSEDILTGALGVPLAQIDNKKKMRVGRVLKALGLERRQVRIDDIRREWRYFAP